MGNAIASTGFWTAAGNPPARPGLASECVEDVPMREKLAVVRDTLIVFGLQIVFRVVLLLRRWNY